MTAYPDLPAPGARIADFPCRRYSATLATGEPVCYSDRPHGHAIRDRVLRAIEAVLSPPDGHYEDTVARGWCACCAFAWPCKTVQAITRELLGEGGDG